MKTQDDLLSEVKRVVRRYPPYSVLAGGRAAAEETSCVGCSCHCTSQGPSSAKAALLQSQVRSRAPFHLHPAAGVVHSATCQHHDGREGQQEGAGGTGRRATILGLTAGGLLAGRGAGAAQLERGGPPNRRSELPAKRLAHHKRVIRAMAGC